MNDQAVFRIQTGNPNGYVEAAAPAICYTIDGSLWVKVDDGKSLTGWVQFLAAPIPE